MAPYFPAVNLLPALLLDAIEAVILLAPTVADDTKGGFILCSPYAAGCQRSQSNQAGCLAGWISQCLDGKSPISLKNHPE